MVLGMISMNNNQAGLVARTAFFGSNGQSGEVAQQLLLLAALEPIISQL